MKKYLVTPGKKFRLKKIDPADTGDFSDDDEGKEKAKLKTEKTVENICDLQERLFAESKQALLIVLQAMDTGGKDGTIEHVMSSVNPQGCVVASFKVPTQEEASHDFLWRVHEKAPAKGYIGIFNRSHYEDVLVTRVHNMIDKKTQERRFGEINDFEKILDHNGTTIIKFFLHISKAEQRRRFQARLDDPKKRWKFKLNDLKERRHWDKYQKTFEETLESTSTSHAPWYVVPADNKWYRNYVVGKIVVNTLKKMDPKFPKLPPEVDPAKIKIR